jgi:hypothetical protein
MAQKEQQRTVYRTARGKEIDLNKLVAKNELTLAVGNMGVNARGDKIGPGGKIIAKQEQLQASTQAIPNQVNVPEIEQPVATPAPASTPTMVMTAPRKDVSNMDPEGKE